MILKLLKWSILIATLVAAVATLSSDIGTVAIEVQGMRIEILAIVLCAAIVLSYIVLTVLFVCIISIARTPGKLLAKLRKKNYEKSTACIIEAILAITNGDYKKATKSITSLNNSETVPEYFIALLECSIAMNNAAKHKDQLKLSLLTLLHHKQTEHTGLLALAYIALMEKNWTSSIRHCKKILAIKYDNRALKILLKAYFNAGLWQEVLEFLQQHEARHIPSSITTQLNTLASYKIIESKATGTNTITIPLNMLDALPKWFIPAIIMKVGILLRNGHIDQAIHLVSSNWAEHKSPLFINAITILNSLPISKVMHAVHKIIAQDTQLHESKLLLLYANIIISKAQNTQEILDMIKNSHNIWSIIALIECQVNMRYNPSTTLSLLQKLKTHLCQSVNVILHQKYYWDFHTMCLALEPSYDCFEVCSIL